MTAHNLLQLTQCVVLLDFDLDREHIGIRVFLRIIEQKCQSVLILSELLMPLEGL